jgi:hypothetical protein
VRRFSVRVVLSRDNAALAASGMWGATCSFLATAADLNESTIKLRIARYEGRDYNKSSRTNLSDRFVPSLLESEPPADDADWPPSEADNPEPQAMRDNDWPPADRLPPTRAL